MNSAPVARGRSLRLGVVAAVAGLALLAPAGLAQEATPLGGAATGDGPHPAHIHSGTCDELGDVVFPLADVALEEGERRGAGSALPIKGSLTVVDAPLEEILGYSGPARSPHCRLAPTSGGRAPSPEARPSAPA